MKEAGKILFAVFGFGWIMAIANDTPSHDHHHHHHGGGHGMHQHWPVPADAARRPNPIAADDASIERGAEIYAKHCAMCHGTTGRGDGPAAAGLSHPPMNLQMMVSHYSDGGLAWKISEGRAPMPAWKGVLTENQIWDVVNYLKRGLGSGKSGG